MSGEVYVEFLGFFVSEILMLWILVFFNLFNIVELGIFIGIDGLLLVLN